jgi:hypothetical protein
MTTNTLPLDGERLLQIARDTGLRHHLHGVDPTAARELLTRYADAVISARTPALLDAIDGAIAFGASGTNPLPVGHWLQRFWDIGRNQRPVRVQALEEAAARCDHYAQSPGLDPWVAAMISVVGHDIRALKGTPAAATDDAPGIELYAARVSEARMSGLVDHLRGLLHAALSAMKTLHGSMEPDGDTANIDARIPGNAVAAFVDEHARLLRAVHVGPIVKAVTPAAAVESQETTAEAFIQAAIDLAPEPLRRLGEWLATALDEDQWAKAERMLLAAAASAADPSIVLHLDRKLGMYGQAFDAPGPCRAYTYQHQPANGAAYRLGTALSRAAAAPGGDSIDGGLSLLKALQAAGFGVFEVEPYDAALAASKENGNG